MRKRKAAIFPVRVHLRGLGLLSVRRSQFGLKAFGKKLPPVSHRYPFFGVTLHPYICTAGSNQFTLTEHDQAAWLQPEELSGLDWAEADVPVLHAYLSWLEKARP